VTAPRCALEWAVVLLPASGGAPEPDQLAEALGRAGLEVILSVAIEEQILGDAVEWHSMAVIRAVGGIDPSAIARSPSGNLVGEGYLSASVILPCQRIELDAVTDQNPRTWDEVDFPPTAEDPALLAVHLLSFEQPDEGSPRRVLDRSMGGLVDPAHGVRPEAWFFSCESHRPEGAWSEIRCNVYPSRAAFMAVVFDPERLGGHSAEESPGLHDPYTLLARLQQTDLEALSRREA